MQFFEAGRAVQLGHQIEKLHVSKFGEQAALMAHVGHNKYWVAYVSRSCKWIFVEG